MCWNRALLVHHTSSQCVPARRVRTLRIARKHARGEILCRRLEWEQGAVSSRVASLLRSAEAKPMFYRFVRSSGPSPVRHPMEVCSKRAAPAHGPSPRRCSPAAPATDGRGLGRARPRTGAASPTVPKLRAHPACMPSSTQWRCVPYLRATCVFVAARATRTALCAAPRRTTPAPTTHPFLPHTHTTHHLRPQNHENTVSRPICEVKHGIV